MNDPNTFGYQKNPGVPMGSGSAPPGTGANPMAQYKFSSEEMNVLQECNRESFFQRSLPLSTILGFGSFAAVQSGYLKPNPRFGAIPKVSLAVVLGYFLGKLSYQQACAEKLMSLPGSYIGQLLRDRRDGKIGGDRKTSFPGGAAGAMFGAGPSDIYSDAGPGSSLDLDTDRPVFNDNDTYRPDNDGTAGSGPEAAKQPTLSYEELRRKNRGEFADSKQDPYRVEPGLGATPRPRPPPPPPSQPRTPLNKYGDALD